MVKVTAVALHTDEQVREIVRAARKIADDGEYEGHEWDCVFSQACVLLGARAPVVEQEQAIPFALPSQLR